MDARSRGTVFTSSAGLVLASIGFTLSVLSMLFRFVVPSDRPNSVIVAAIRRPSLRQRPSTSTNLSISSRATSSSEGSSPPRLPSHKRISARRARSRSLERAIHIRNVSERIGTDRARREFRTTDRPRRRRSESTPPTPSPRQWEFSKEEMTAPPLELPVCTSPLEEELSLSPHLGVDVAAHSSPVDPAPSNSQVHRSFLHFPKKPHRSPIVMSSDASHAPYSDPVGKRRSQIFAPLLHKRRDPRRRWSLASSADEGDEPSSGSSPDATAEEHPATAPGACGRPSLESIRLRNRHLPLPKRTQTLRTRPYEAPYFFPAPGSVEAVDYLPPKRSRPRKSKTLPTERPPSIC